MITNIAGTTLIIIIIRVFFSIKKKYKIFFRRPYEIFGVHMLTYLKNE